MRYRHENRFTLNQPIQEIGTKLHLLMIKLEWNHGLHFLELGKLSLRVTVHGTRIPFARRIGTDIQNYAWSKSLQRITILNISKIYESKVNETFNRMINDSNSLFQSGT
jgi:hypothetical protein